MHRIKLPRFNCLGIALAVMAFAVLPPRIATESMKQCRRACDDAIRACMAGGQHQSACRRQLLGRCKVEGRQACATEASRNEPGGAPGVTGVVTADAYVHQSRPNQNFVTSPILAVDADPVQYTFLKIRVSGVDGGQVTRARLLLTVSADEPFAERSWGGSLHLANCDWQESSITWNTRPAFDSTVLTSAGPVKLGQVVAFDVTDVITGDGDYCFALDTTAAAGVHYKSSRAAQSGPKAELVVSVPSSTTSTRSLTASSPTRQTCNKPGSLCQTPTASGCTGATSLPVFNPTHYEVQIGTTITGKIIGATDLTGAETCSSGGSGVDVIVKSSNFGNTTLCGTLSGCPRPAWWPTRSTGTTPTTTSSTTGSRTVRPAPQRATRTWMRRACSSPVRPRRRQRRPRRRRPPAPPALRPPAPRPRRPRARVRLR